MPDQPVVAARVPACWELAGLMLAAWLAFVAIPLSQGGIGVSWDALNHHIYLGWTADQHRLDQDFLAAGYQALTFPYLYWPVYKLAAAGASGTWTGVVLATLHLFVVPPLWMMSRTCIPGEGWFEVTMRAMSVTLAFLSGVVLSMFDSTSNDLLAAVPLVWSLAFALQATSSIRARQLPARQAVMLSGLLGGVAVACKLSNGPLAILLPALWLFSGGHSRERLTSTAYACIAAVTGFLLTYGYWGWQLWSRFGNPIYPFYDSAFEPLRRLLEWSS
jgi:hypothetical protein